MSDTLFWGVHLFIALVFGVGAIIGFQTNDTKWLGKQLFELRMILLVAVGTRLATGRKNIVFLMVAILFVLTEALFAHRKEKFPKTRVGVIFNLILVVIFGVIYGCS